MASPMARHWMPGGPVKAIRVHDRGSPGANRDRCREAWSRHGASLVPQIEDVVGGDRELDGVFVCCGKNGDDLPLIAKLAKLLRRDGANPFICHMSTVSAGFAEAANSFCARQGVDYVNYPLTGGPIGAEKATMLILASGSAEVYERLHHALSKLGTPKYFGKSPSAATEVKLMGQAMVFNGLIGICSAAALHSECFQDGQLGGIEQSEFFDFLNAGAGGTRQWDVILSSGIRNDIWDAPFLSSYGAIDAIYTAKCGLDRGLSALAIRPLIDVALAFSYVLNQIGPSLATHAIVREMVKQRARELDQFIGAHSGPANDLQVCIERCVKSLPIDLQAKVAIGVREEDFDRV